MIREGRTDRVEETAWRKKMIKNSNHPSRLINQPVVNWKRATRGDMAGLGSLSPFALFRSFPSSLSSLSSSVDFNVCETHSIISS